MESIPFLVVTVMLGVLVLVVSFILLLLRNQNRLAAEKNKRQETEIKHQEELLASVIQSQEAERSRIGRDLHDGVGASLYNLRLTLDRLEKAGEGDPLIRSGKALIDDLIRDVRTISHNLSPEIFTIRTLTEAVEELCYRVDASGLSVFLTDPTGGVLDRLEQPSAVALYRVMEELFANTIKHAQARFVHVDISVEGNWLVVDYRDDGKGMPGMEGIKKGMGLQNIESRLRMIKASYNQHRASYDGAAGPTSGYHIHISMPLSSN